MNLCPVFSNGWPSLAEKCTDKPIDPQASDPSEKNVGPIEVQTHAPQRVQEDNNREAAGQEHVHVTSDTQCRKTATNYQDTTPARHCVEDAKGDLA